MQKKTKIIIVLIVVMIVLLTPVQRNLPDGGSVSYKSLTYEVVKIHQPSDTTNYTNPNYDLGEYADGLEIKVLGKTIYSKGGLCVWTVKTG